MPLICLNDVSVSWDSTTCERARAVSEESVVNSSGLYVVQGSIPGLERSSLKRNSADMRTFPSGFSEEERH